MIVSLAQWDKVKTLHSQDRNGNVAVLQLTDLHQCAVLIHITDAVQLVELRTAIDAAAEWLLEEERS